jgi:hypothetical protein
MEIIIVFIFGLPLALIALGTALVGLIRKRHWFLAIAAGLIIPSSYYLSGGPGSRRLPLLLPLFLLASAYAVYKKKMFAAWVMILPVLLAVAYYVYVFVYAQTVNP